MIYHGGRRSKGRILPCVFGREAEDDFAPLLDLAHLGGQSDHEVLDPASQVHAALTHALQGCVESGPVAIVKLAQREQAFEG